jgi:hypothetical protein
MGKYGLLFRNTHPKKEADLEIVKRFFRQVGRIFSYLVSEQRENQPCSKLVAFS